MMVVLTIMSLIFLMIIPDIDKTMNVVYEKSCRNQMALINEQILLYQLKNDEVPDSVDDLILEGMITPAQCVCHKGHIEIEDEKAVYVP